MPSIASSLKTSLLGGALAFGVVLGGAGLSHALGAASLAPANAAAEAVAQKQKVTFEQVAETMLAADKVLDY